MSLNYQRFFFMALLLALAATTPHFASFESVSAGALASVGVALALLTLSWLALDKVMLATLSRPHPAVPAFVQMVVCGVAWLALVVATDTMRDDYATLRVVRLIRLFVALRLLSAASHWLAWMRFRSATVTVLARLVLPAAIVATAASMIGDAAGVRVPLLDQVRWRELAEYVPAAIIGLMLSLKLDMYLNRRAPNPVQTYFGLGAIVVGVFVAVVKFSMGLDDPYPLVKHTSVLAASVMALPVVLSLWQPLGFIAAGVVAYAFAGEAPLVALLITAAMLKCFVAAPRSAPQPASAPAAQLAR